MSDDVFLIP